eukprot:TRINITY_DN13065_c0_g1_i1.p1 TRINITY_DN13065_c0_g1~~TRINITY_DN13065_c0_g1_i1.p1  ORF type:complete len:167 (-),score=13.46 TRINITY_DN13065_c0_g1_i1:193-693(-)
MIPGPLSPFVVGRDLSRCFFLAVERADDCRLDADWCVNPPSELGAAPRSALHKPPMDANGGGDQEDQAGEDQRHHHRRTDLEDGTLVASAGENDGRQVRHPSTGTGVRDGERPTAPTAKVEDHREADLSRPDSGDDDSEAVRTFDSTNLNERLEDPTLEELKKSDQ